MKRTIVGYAIILIVLLVITVCTLNITAPSDAQNQYFCDYQHMTLDMEVVVEDMNGNKLYDINGEVFAAFEDDLAMATANGDVVCYTNDIYNLISQNAHEIYRDEQLIYTCDGKIKIFADSYNVYDKDNNKIAYVDFNMFDTVGIMRNVDGDVIARYDSALSRKDYIVSVYDNCNIDDESVLMIFASYVSDLRADD